MRVILKLAGKAIGMGTSAIHAINRKAQFSQPLLAYKWGKLLSLLLSIMQELAKNTPCLDLAKFPLSQKSPFEPQAQPSHSKLI